MDIEEHKAALDDLRSDPRLTAQRYDEIIGLRMFLLDIYAVIKNSTEPNIQVMAKRLIIRARTWGEEGDCV